ncbi:MAG: lysylphosphatidylglycerol synthase transmembrane domain-containing protein [Sumerlaeia bacterium]
MNRNWSDLCLRGKEMAKSRTGQTLLFLLAAGLFLYGIVLSIRRRPDLLLGLDWLYLLAVVMILIPATLLLLAYKFIFLVRYLGADISFLDAFRTVVMGAAGNLLPVPGGLMVRVAVLRSKGIPIGKSVAINIDLTIFWIGCALLLSSVGAFFQQKAGFGFGFLGGGLLVLGIAAGLIYRKTKSRESLWVFFGLQFAGSLIDSLRVWVCMLSMERATSLSSVFGLSLASVSGSLATVVPAGLGVREWVAAFLAPVFQLPPESAYLGTALNRFLSLGVVFLISLFFLVQARSKRKEVKEREHDLE